MKDVKSIIEIPTITLERYQSKILLWDNFLNGGFVPSQCVLLGGDPGAGKSTLLTQLSTVYSQAGHKFLYISGEEDLSQMKLRSTRIEAENKLTYCSDETDLESIFETIKDVNPHFIIIDSLQMITSAVEKGEEGSSRQTKYCLKALIKHAKRNKRVLIIVNHSTKGGKLAGLQTLQHAIDTVMWLKKGDEGERTIHMIKNRFGMTEASFPLTMTEKGFEELNDGMRQTALSKKDYSSTELLEEIKDNRATSFFVRIAINRLKDLLNAYDIEFTIIKNKKGISY